MELTNIMRSLYIDTVPESAHHIQWLGTTRRILTEVEQRKAMTPEERILLQEGLNTCALVLQQNPESALAMTTAAHIRILLESSSGSSKVAGAASEGKPTVLHVADVEDLLREVANHLEGLRCRGVRVTIPGREFRTSLLEFQEPSFRLFVARENHLDPAAVANLRSALEALEGVPTQEILFLIEGSEARRSYRCDLQSSIPLAWRIATRLHSPIVCPVRNLACYEVVQEIHRQAQENLPDLTIEEVIGWIMQIQVGGLAYYEITFSGQLVRETAKAYALLWDQTIWTQESLIAAFKAYADLTPLRRASLESLLPTVSHCVEDRFTTEAVRREVLPNIQPNIICVCGAGHVKSICDGLGVDFEDDKPPKGATLLSFPPSWRRGR